MKILLAFSNSETCFFLCVVLSRSIRYHAFETCFFYIFWRLQWVHLPCHQIGFFLLYFGGSMIEATDYTTWCPNYVFHITACMFFDLNLFIHLLYPIIFLPLAFCGSQVSNVFLCFPKNSLSTFQGNMSSRNLPFSLPF